MEHVINLNPYQDIWHITQADVTVQCVIIILKKNFCAVHVAMFVYVIQLDQIEEN